MIFCNEDDMELTIEPEGEIDIRDRNLHTGSKLGALEYTRAEKCGKLRWYVLDKTGKVLESLVSIHSLQFTLDVSGVKYAIPVMVDTINLDDRDYSGKDRALIFYVKGFPEIQHRLDGHRRDNALYQDALEGFRGYLELAIKRIQREENVEEKFLALSSFRVHTN